MKNILLLISLILSISSSYAESTVDSEGKLTINIESSAVFSTNTVVTCSELGFTSINGLAPFNGSFPCTSISSIVVNGSILQDLIDLSTISKINFPNLKSVKVFGNNANDTLKGSAIKDTIKGGSGDDIIEGNDGNDRLVGESGNDNIKGGKGADTIIGGSGNDKLYGQAGKDIISGNSGNDRILGGSSYDLLSGGSGINKVIQ